MMRQLNVIGAIPYKFCKEFCHLLKQGYGPAIKTAARILVQHLPDKSVLIPVPGHTGIPGYTFDMANDIAGRKKGVIFMDFLQCLPHESLCEMKSAGLPIESLDFVVNVNQSEIPRLKGLIERGYAVVLIDNVVDTGKTACACIDAIHHAVNKDIEIFIMAIGDTGVHNILCENKPSKIQ